MRRWIARSVWAMAVLAAISSAEAKTHPPRPVTPSRYCVRAVYQYRGRTYERITYPGYIHKLPPPAFLYYGYPQNGSTSGVGF